MVKQNSVRLLLLGVFITTLFIIFALHKVSATAGINSELSFEGKIVTTAGINIPNGTYNMEFKIYSGGTATGGGTLDWTEDYLIGGSGGVSINSGIFQVNLGSVNTTLATSVNWNSTPLYLSIQIGNTASCTITTSFQANCGGDGEMTPYILLTASPYSFNSAELNGLSSSAFGQLSATQTWTGANNFQSATNSTSAFTIQNSSATDLLVADTTNNRIGIGTSTPISELNVETSTYSSNQFVLSDGVTGTPPSYVNNYLPSLVVQTAETTGSRPLFFGYNNGTGWGAFLTSGACGSFNFMCLDLGSGSTVDTALVNEASNLYVGGGPDGNFANVIIPTNTSINALTVGSASTTNGTINFASSAGTNLASISAPSSNPSSSYTLNLPIAPPATGQCLQAGATTADQLIFGSCATGTGTGGGVTSVGALDGGTANSSGATISGSIIYLQSASASYPGLVNTTTQTFAGSKTFSSALALSAGITGPLSVSGATTLSSTLAVTGTTTLSGSTTLPGGAVASTFSGGSWINLPTTGPSGIGSGGAGADAWLGYSKGNSNWFNNALAGDINIRNTTGSLNFGNTSGNLAVSILNNELGVGLRGATSLLDVAGPIATAIVTETASYTITASNSTILANGAITITLPTASGISGRQYTIKNISSSTVTLASAGGTIDGSTTISLTSKNEAVTVQSDGTNWYVIGEVGTTIL